jgi:uncharacterized protein (DUF488 family)
VSTPTVWTVGHGTRSTEELVAVLRSAGVERLLDVRRHPGSRRHPHLAEGPLRRALPSLGVAYEWWGEPLGGRRRPDPDSPNVAWRNDSFRGYADHTRDAVYRDAVTSLEADAATGERVAVMCAERLWWRCHRRLVADTLVLRGTAVVHLVEPHMHRPHELHPAARRAADGWPIWDGVEPATLF